MALDRHEAAQRLFHEKGYDALSVADLTRALGINRPSFYAAFGSKAGLYARILDRSAVTGAIALARILAADRPLAAALAAALEEAARGFHVAAQAFIRDSIAARCPQQAGELADFVCTTMAGMSASARHGQSLARLLGTARLAGAAIRLALPG